MVSERYKFYMSDRALLDYTNSTLLTSGEKIDLMKGRDGIYMNRAIFDKQTPWTAYELSQIQKMSDEQANGIKSFGDLANKQIDTAAIDTLKTRIDKSNEDLTKMREDVEKAIAAKPSADLFSYESNKLSNAYIAMCTQSLEVVNKAFLAEKAAAGSGKIPTDKAEVLRAFEDKAKKDCLGEIKSVSDSPAFKTVAAAINTLMSSGSGLGKSLENLLSEQDLRSVYLAKIAGKLYSGSDMEADKKKLDDLGVSITDAMKIEAEIEAKLDEALSLNPPTKDDFAAFSKIPVDPKVLSVPFDELLKEIDAASETAMLLKS